MDAPAESRDLTQAILTPRAEAGVTRALYTEYRGLREQLFAALREAHAGLPPRDLLGHAQTILDRILFVAFAEGRGLLPRDTLAKAVRRGSKQGPVPLWDNLRALFRGIFRGDPGAGIPAYGGALFRPVEGIDRLEVPDATCAALAGLARYDFRDAVSIDVLGHVFERSIGDLERLRRGAGGGDTPSSKRHDEGVYYTPAPLTRYIVDLTLGRTLRGRREAVFDRIRPEGRRDEEDRIAATIEAWEAYRDALEQVRVLDPACGAGAFLVAAHDALRREHARVEGALCALRGGRVGAFDAGETILHENLFGVDVSAASVEITRLSLWLATARHGKRLADLDGNVRCGDSLVTDPRLSRAPPGWPEGFDVVIGNPPYVRHELLAPVKEQLRTAYAVHHGMADLYVYFFERALALLKPGGRLGFIVSNKWLRAGYAGPLRALLAGRTAIETVIDFGHAPIFADADASPCVVVLRKLAEGERVAPDHALSVTAFPRAALEEADVAGYVARTAYSVPQARLGEGAWSLEPGAVARLFEKIRAAGAPLGAYAEAKPYYGIKTGCNEAFVVDAATRDRLVREDPASAGVLKPLLRGQDMGRWSPARTDLWMIYAPWDVPIARFPAVLAHLQRFRSKLEGRAEVRAGRFPWHALSRYAADSVDRFAPAKIVYQVIQYHPAYGIDHDGRFLNDKGFFIPTADPWLLAVLNAPLMWWYTWRYLGHMKDEALNPAGVKMAQLPIAAPDDEARAVAGDHVPRLVAFAREAREARSRAIPGTRAVPVDDHAGAQAHAMERRLSDLVDRAYGLTREDVALLWDTAPPRMPVGR